jgi:molybdopterin adenylyltransferase
MPAPQHLPHTVPHVACAVLTVSDSRTRATDDGGQGIIAALTAAGHEVYAYDILADDPAVITARVRQLRDDPRCQAVLLTGGTGVTARDTTPEAVVGLLDQRLDGFGELFRMLSYAEIGAAAMLSRAVAGVAGRTVVFAMPGSPHAVQLAMEKLVIPELGHLAWLVGRPSAPPSEGNDRETG